MVFVPGYETDSSYLQWEKWKLLDDGEEVAVAYGGDSLSDRMVSIPVDSGILSRGDGVGWDHLEDGSVSLAIAFGNGQFGQQAFGITAGNKNCCSIHFIEKVVFREHRLDIAVSLGGYKATLP